MCRLFVILGVIVAFATGAVAHNVPVQLPEPKSAGEAWNVIEESATNVDKLFVQRLPRDIAFQLANSATALKWLGQHGDPKELTDRMIGAAADMIRALQSRSEPLAQTKQSWK